jgi:hypothetical protein
MAKANVTDTIQFDGKEVYFSVTVYGKCWRTKEKRVDGNPTMIESFAESGVNVDDWEFDELIIDGEHKDGDEYYHTPLADEIQGYLEEAEDKGDIMWEYDEW